VNPLIDTPFSCFARCHSLGWLLNVSDTGAADSNGFLTMPSNSTVSVVASDRLYIEGSLVGGRYLIAGSLQISQHLRDADLLQFELTNDTTQTDANLIVGGCLWFINAPATLTVLADAAFRVPTDGLTVPLISLSTTCTNHSSFAQSALTLMQPTPTRRCQPALRGHLQQQQYTVSLVLDGQICDGDALVASSSGNGVSSGAIAGVVIVILVGAVFLVGVLIWYRRRRRTSALQIEALEEAYEATFPSHTIASDLLSKLPTRSTVIAPRSLGDPSWEW
jgi:hypothetical protein